MPNPHDRPTPAARQPRLVAALAPLVAALVVAAVLVSPSLVTASAPRPDDVPADDAGQVEQVAAAAAAPSKRWKTMKTYKRAKLQACRPASGDGYSHLLVRMRNRHKKAERRAEVWVKNAEVGKVWTSSAHSGWTRSGGRKVFARFSSTGELQRQKVRVKMRTRSRSAKFGYFAWSRVPTC
ncbi:hypothetical protein I601_2936 [Nocardioides dokdonensis FR1436]|uniref:Uncharacterized protein n=1 Tax=Nocardioides dokdonensis FR1436 TaxID=1300347 RepID=A0A1A9GPE4_9ACTN|nr:hypothetical protein [Nocardioides dokdonensis]ANH39351.1 hypothetical protein I601_2936 [Nocardioides dokdonensis FR1436]